MYKTLIFYTTISFQCPLNTIIDIHKIIYLYQSIKFWMTAGFYGVVQIWYNLFTQVLCNLITKIALFLYQNFLSYYGIFLYKSRLPKLDSKYTKNCIEITWFLWQKLQVQFWYHFCHNCEQISVQKSLYKHTRITKKIRI